MQYSKQTVRRAASAGYMTEHLPAKNDGNGITAELLMKNGIKVYTAAIAIIAASIAVHRSTKENDLIAALMDCTSTNHCSFP